ncbi:MAG TPA: T9SS type A sorting domain-containing protein [Bacteroidales bacterium]|jgi:hypothetical protein|nr:T9SS type A sorting domain-containing protein [Bacteroidales bacterium]HPT08809.1 T9SS type A sorting domain-containing protein [Bacteroidales bacterium]
MRYFAILFLLVFSFGQTRAQVTLEKTMTESTWYTQLPTAGYKYFGMDVTNNQCKIYNLDYTLWKTIQLSIPTGYTLYDIQFVSQNLFSTDGQIGLAYMYYQYNSTGQYYTYGVKIIKENGTILATIPGAAYMYVIPTGSNGTKFITYQFDYSTWPYFQGTNIYSLPGTLVNAPENPVREQDLMKNPYPNPSTTQITIPLSLSAQDISGTLVVTDMNGKEILNKALVSGQKEVLVNTTSFPRGLYHYSIIAGGIPSENGKFIVERP